MSRLSRFASVFRGDRLNRDLSPGEGTEVLIRQGARRQKMLVLRYE